MSIEPVIVMFERLFVASKELKTVWLYTSAWSIWFLLQTLNEYPFFNRISLPVEEQFSRFAVLFVVLTRVIPARTWAEAEVDGVEAFRVPELVEL